MQQPNVFVIEKAIPMKPYQDAHFDRVDAKEVQECLKTLCPTTSHSRCDCWHGAVQPRIDVLIADLPKSLTYNLAAYSAGFKL